MTVKEILKYGITFIGDSHLLALNTFNTSSNTSPTPDQQADIDLYLGCFNLIYKEIASSYFPLIEKEKIVFTDNKYSLSNLTKKIINIKKLSKGNKKLKYFIYPTYLYCETDYANIIYSTLPDDLSLTDETNLFSGRVLPQVMGYGIAREYSYITGDFVSADMWDVRFKNALQTSFSMRKNFGLPARRFI